MRKVPESSPPQMQMTIPDPCARADPPYDAVRRLDRFDYAVIKRILRPPTCAFNAVVGHDVISLVGILANLRFGKNKFRDVIPYRLAEFKLRKIRIGQSDVVSLSFHRVVPLDSM